MCIRKHPTLLNVTMCVSEIHVAHMCVRRRSGIYRAMACQSLW